MKKIFLSLFIILILATIAYATITQTGNDLHIPGNISTNQFYGGMWNYSANATAWTFGLTEGIYENLTGLSEGDVNGFSMTCAAGNAGGCYLTAVKDGTYQVNAQVSGAGSPGGGLVSLAVVQNFDVDNHRDCYARRQISNNIVGSFGISCFMCVSAGDTINIQIENEASSTDIKIHTVNMILTRVGD